MSFYNNNNNNNAESWSAPGRQPSWEQPAPPSRSGSTSVASNEPLAFSSQFEEVDRALDNLVKSGKFFGAGPFRRESMPPAGRQYHEHDTRSGGLSRHHSVSEYDGGRSNSAAGLQGFYAAQRFQPRQSEAEQMLQAKRRMAAQRERELRNYHQEQQYNRTSSSGVKSERSVSPNNLNEEERRDLIARQHRALYGNEASIYTPDGSSSRPSQDARMSTSTSVRGASPLAFDSFGMQSQQGGESAVQMPPRDMAAASERRPSASPPSANPANFESAPQVGRTSGSPTTTIDAAPQGGKPVNTPAAGAVPIGTRPAQASAAVKRSTTPNERSASAASNPSFADKAPGFGGWGSNSGVWGAPKNSYGVQAPVWG